MTSRPPLIYHRTVGPDTDTCAMIILRVSCPTMIMLGEIDDEGSEGTKRSEERRRVGTQAPTMLCPDKICVCFQNILESGHDALDGLVGSDWGRIVARQFHMPLSKGEL